MSSVRDHITIRNSLVGLAIVALLVLPFVLFFRNSGVRVEQPPFQAPPVVSAQPSREALAQEIRVLDGKIHTQMTVLAMQVKFKREKRESLKPEEAENLDRSIKIVEDDIKALQRKRSELLKSLGPERPDPKRSSG